MLDKGTILEGCEVICIGEQNTDLIARPLSRDEQLKCEKGRQYQAGRTEVIKWVNINLINYIYPDRFGKAQEWRAQLSVWGH